MFSELCVMRCMCVILACACVCVCVRVYHEFWSHGAVNALISACTYITMENNPAGSIL